VTAATTLRLWPANVALPCPLRLMVYRSWRVAPTGKLRAQDRIEIKKDSSVAGELTTGRIMIEDGANFKGAVEIERSSAKVAIAPETLLALAEKDFKLKSIRSVGSGQP
jgi:hypothetical protein